MDLLVVGVDGGFGKGHGLLSFDDKADGVAIEDGLFADGVSCGGEGINDDALMRRWCGGRDVLGKMVWFHVVSG